MAAIASVNPSGYSPSTLQVVRPGGVAAEYPAPATIQVPFKTHRAMRMAVARCTHSEDDPPLVSAISREGNHTAMSRIVSGEEKHQGTDRNHTAEGQKPYGCEEKPYGHSRSTTYTATETTAEETSTSTSKQKERKVNRARDRETVPSNKEGSPPRESRQEAASARPGEPSDQTGRA